MTLEQKHYEARIIYIDTYENERDYSDVREMETDYFETLEEAREGAKRLIKYTFYDKSEWDNKFVRIKKVTEFVDEDGDFVKDSTYETIEDIKR